MKKASMFLLCVTALLAVLIISEFPHTRQPVGTSSVAISTMSSNFTSIAPSSQENSGIITGAGAKDNSLYIVKEYKGHIGVFREGEETPFEEIDVDISVFPEEDQQLLRNGIQARGTAELTKVIEDYEG